jgi:hypothetical protein
MSMFLVFLSEQTKSELPVELCILLLLCIAVRHTVRVVDTLGLLFML